LQHIANNLPEAFTDYKDITKSFYPARNGLERVEVLIKTIQLPLPKKRGRSTTSPKDNGPSKRPRISSTKSSKSVNLSQPQVGKHPIVDKNPKLGPNPQPGSTMHPNFDPRTSKHPDSIVLKNVKSNNGVKEISINYIDSRESYDHKTTVVDIYFSAAIAEIFLNDPNPKTIPECKKCSDWAQWKEAIQAEIASLTKRGVFTSAIPTPSKVFPAGFKWVFVQKQNENNEVVRYKARLVAQGFT
jgi:hypothetical protein